MNTDDAMLSPQTNARSAAPIWAMDKVVRRSIFFVGSFRYMLLSRCHFWNNPPSKALPIITLICGKKSYFFVVRSDWEYVYRFSRIGKQYISLVLINAQFSARKRETDTANLSSRFSSAKHESISALSWYTLSLGYWKQVQNVFNESNVVLNSIKSYLCRLHQH